MGIIIRQSFWNLIFTYIGVVIGFVNVTILRPLFLGFNQIGTIELLANYAGLFSNVCSLGFGHMILRLYPKLRDKPFEGGVLKYALYVILIGSIIGGLSIYLLKDQLIGNNSEGTGISNYFILLYPWLLSNVLYGIFDSYLRIILKSVIGVILREIIQRILITTTLLLFYLKFINSDTFFLLYAFSFFVPSIVIFVYVLKLKGLISFSPKVTLYLFSSKLKKETLDLSFWGVLGGLGGVLTLSIDRYMINYFEGEYAVGIYSTLIAYATLIIIPSRSLKRISSSIISHAWANKDMDEIQTIYIKSSLNQLIISLVLFLGILSFGPLFLNNFKIELYENFNILIFLCLGFIIENMTGVNAEIIASSEKYKYNTYFYILLGVISIILNSILINLLGMLGIAIATSLSWLIINIFRIYHLKSNYNLFPFNKKTIYVILLFTPFLLCNYFLHIENIIFEISFKFFTFLICIILIFKMNISSDLNNILKNVLKYFKL